MSKTPKIISIFLAGLFCLLFVSCDGKPTTDANKTELVASVVKSDLQEGVLYASAEGGTIGYEATLKLVTKENSTRDFDLYFMTYEVGKAVTDREKSACAVFSRDKTLYRTKFIGSDRLFYSIASTNYELEVNNLLSSGKAQIVTVTDKQIINGVFEVLIQTFFKTPDESYVDFPSFTDATINFLKNEGSLNLGSATKVYNGFRLSVDLISNINVYLNTLISIGENIDNAATMTVGELYVLPEFTQIFKPLLQYTSAKTVESIINIVLFNMVGESYKTFFTIPSAQQSENGYDYLNRFINTKVQGFTIASMRINDLIEIAGGNPDEKLKDYFYSFKNDLLDAVKKFTDTFKIVYFFDEEMSLTRISADFNLKESNFDSSVLITYQSSHVKFNYYPMKVSSGLCKL